MVFSVGVWVGHSVGVEVRVRVAVGGGVAVAGKVSVAGGGVAVGGKVAVANRVAVAGRVTAGPMATGAPHAVKSRISAKRVPNLPKEYTPDDPRIVAANIGASRSAIWVHFCLGELSVLFPRSRE